MAQVKDWMVSGFGLAPGPLGVRPTVDLGPVVRTREVRVVEMNEEKIWDGERVEDVTSVARARGAVIVARRAKRVFESFVRGCRERMAWIMVERSARRVAMDEVVRVRRVGVRFVSVGQRGRENDGGRWVVL